MKTTPLLRAIVMGGGITLLANPVWAEGGSHSYDRNQAGYNNPSQSQTQSSQLNQQQTKQVQEALQEQGFDPGRIDGIMGSQTKQALSDFQRKKDLPVTGTVDEQTAEQLGIEMSPGSGGKERMPDQGSQSNDGMPPDRNQ
jgi:peptidoglycan hydrolase-like protein with peptidoglycan-binding domain